MHPHLLRGQGELMSMLSTDHPLKDGFDPPALRFIKGSLSSGDRPIVMTFDGFPVFEDDPLRESHLLLDAYLRETAPHVRRGDNAKTAANPTGQAILNT